MNAAAEGRQWTEQFLTSLRAEDDSFERKGSKALDLNVTGVDENRVREELAKQLSAFANTGGGSIAYGVHNNGGIDSGGVSRQVKGGTKEWLEDIIPVLTDPIVVGVNVCEVVPKRRSQIARGKAVYIVEIPDSPGAPHQSKLDFRYYVRIGGKSSPAPHRLIEDIRNRAKHPGLTLHMTLMLITLSNRKPLEPQLGVVRTGETCEACLNIELRLANESRVKATNSCVCVVSDEAGMQHRWNPYSGLYKCRLDSGSRVYFDLESPLYPTMEVPIRLSSDLWCEIRNEALYLAPEQARWGHKPFMEDLC